MVYIFCFILIIQFITGQDKFNYFKSYANSDIKPPNYSKDKKHLRHSIEEYLTSNQKRMHKIRNSRNTPDVMYDKNWSGYKSDTDNVIKHSN